MKKIPFKTLIQHSKSKPKLFSSSSKMDPPNSKPISISSTFSPNPNSINASSSLRKPLSLWPGMYHSPVTNALWEARSSIFEKLLDASKEDDGRPQMELLTRTPSQSRTVILYGFENDFILREQYRDPWNEVRVGKLLEDLDALAGTIAVKVDVGDFLRFKSCVLYTQLENPEQPLVNIEVVAHVTRPELRTSEVSNTFYFTFTVNPDALKNGLRIRNVVPATEEEARRVIERMDAENTSP